MKKLLSIVLAIAMMMTMAFAASASTANMLEGTLEVSGDGTATGEYKDGVLTITSTGEGGSVGIVGPGEYDAATLKYVHLAIESDVPFIISMYDGANEKWLTSNGDFFPQFGLDAGDKPAPAGKYELSLYTNGCYTWDGSALPATVAMSAIYIEPKAAGTITVTTLGLSDQEEFAAGGNNSGSNDDTKTTTTKKQSSSKDDNPKTGVESDAIALAVVALAAAGVVTLSVVSKKAKSR